MTTHGCTEVRVGIWARTLCGLEVRQAEDRQSWQTRRWRPVLITRDPRQLTCASCERVRG